MKRFGNDRFRIAVVRRIERMWSADTGSCQPRHQLIIFPEAKRTRDGHVDQFQTAASGGAAAWGVAILPSACWDRSHHRTGHWKMLWPAKITVYLH